MITAKAIFWFAMAVVVVIIVPIFMVMSMRQHLREKNHSNGRRRPGGVVVGNALQELDRLVARPSVEYTIEAERPLLKREDGRGGN
jgi:hypothetical protein